MFVQITTVNCEIEVGYIGTEDEIRFMVLMDKMKLSAEQLTQSLNQLSEAIYKSLIPIMNWLGEVFKIQ
jgi:hypothetical protein